MSQEDAIGWGLSLVAVALLTCGVLGIRSCTIYDRQQEVACRGAGGEILMLSGHSGCYRLNAEHIQVGK